MLKASLFTGLLVSPLASFAQTQGVAPLEPISSPYLLKLTGGLILVVAIIFLFAWLVKKLNLNQHTQNGLIRIVGGLSIGTRDRIVLLQVGEEQILLGLSPGKIEKLHTLQKPLQTGEIETQVSPFAEKLQRLMKQRENS